jgi:transposase
MKYSVHFRKKVLSVKKKERLSLAAISRKFGVSKNTVFLWTKNITPKSHREKPPTKIREDITRYSDAYQYERAERLGVSQSAIYSALKRLKVTYKKISKASHGKRRREAKI